MHCQVHNQSLSSRACTINFSVNSQGHAPSISLSVPITKVMHCQLYNQSLSPRACTVNFTVNSLGHQSLSPRAFTINFTTNSLGHALSISQSVPMSKGMYYQFHYQFPRTCTVNFTISPISKGMLYKFHYQFPRTCTVKFTVGPYFQGHALSISLSVLKDMHCQFHNQSLSPRACTVNFTISLYLQGHALSISQSVPVSKGMHYQFSLSIP